MDIREGEERQTARFGRGHIDIWALFNCGILKIVWEDQCARGKSQKKKSGVLSGESCKRKINAMQHPNRLFYQTRRSIRLFCPLYRTTGVLSPYYFFPLSSSERRRRLEKKKFSLPISQVTREKGGGKVTHY